jgi:hypothetical protein
LFRDRVLGIDDFHDNLALLRAMKADTSLPC